MLGGSWLTITVVLLAAAALLRQVPLLLVALLFLLASGVARLWSRYSLDRLEYTRRLSADRAIFGETITLETTVSNRKVLPLPWVHVEDEVPQGVTFLKGRPRHSHKPARLLLSYLVSLSWYYQVTRRYTIQCLTRGHFAFGPASIRSSDLFGFFGRQASKEKLDYLTVYPRVVPLESLGILSKEPFGDLRVRRHLFEDPVQVATTRDYAAGDPLRRIHWKATARVQRLQSRVFERTTSVDMAVFLDVATVPPPFWGVSEQRLETAVIAAASIASFALSQGYRTGLYVNEPYQQSEQAVRLPPSDHPDQLGRILETLAHVRGWPHPALEDILGREARGLPWAATVAVVTSVPTENLLAALIRLRRAGRRVALIVVGGDGTPAGLDGLPVYRVSDQVYRRELASVRLS
ncbi:MAG: DUF58 domain-containing protein [Chloroflexi bacterium]|nr:DUF58 domain-containing protein [Chloroflexota bacterium]